MNRIGILSLTFSSCVKILVSPTVGTDSEDRSPGSLQEVGTITGKPFSQEMWGFICQWLTVVTKVTWKHNAEFFWTLLPTLGAHHRSFTLISESLLWFPQGQMPHQPSRRYSSFIQLLLIFPAPDLEDPPEFGWELSYILGPVFSPFCIVGYLAFLHYRCYHLPSAFQKFLNILICSWRAPYTSPRDNFVPISCTLCHLMGCKAGDIHSQ